VVGVAIVRVASALLIGDSFHESGALGGDRVCRVHLVRVYAAPPRRAEWRTFRSQATERVAETRVAAFRSHATKRVAETRVAALAAARIFFRHENVAAAAAANIAIVVRCRRARVDQTLEVGGGRACSRMSRVNTSVNTNFWRRRRRRRRRCSHTCSRRPTAVSCFADSTH
jgi:hypothetical protein